MLNAWSLSLKDAFTASIIRKYSDTSNKLEHTDDGYVWINHQYLLNQFPILNVSNRQLGRLLKGLVDKGVIQKRVVWSDRSGRRKTYYKMSESYCEGVQFYSNIHGSSKTGINYNYSKDTPQVKIPPDSSEHRLRIPAGLEGAGRFRGK